MSDSHCVIPEDEDVFGRLQARRRLRRRCLGAEGPKLPMMTYGAKKGKKKEKEKEIERGWGEEDRAIKNK